MSEQPLGGAIQPSPPQTSPPHQSLNSVNSGNHSVKLQQVSSTNPQNVNIKQQHFNANSTSLTEVVSPVGSQPVEVIQINEILPTSEHALTNSNSLNFENRTDCVQIVNHSLSNVSNDNSIKSASEEYVVKSVTREHVSGLSNKNMLEEHLEKPVSGDQGTDISGEHEVKGIHYSEGQIKNVLPVYVCKSLSGESVNNEQAAINPVSSVGQIKSSSASAHPTLVSTLTSPPRQRTSPLSPAGSQPNAFSPSSLANMTRASSGAVSNTVTNVGTFNNTHSIAPRKRLRFSEIQEKPPPNEEIKSFRKRVIDNRMVCMKVMRERYAEHAAELFFLHAGGNMMDYHTWRKRPSTPQFLHFLRSHRLDPDDDDEDLSLLLPTTTQQASTIQPSALTDVSTSKTLTQVVSALPVVHSSVQGDMQVITEPNSSLPSSSQLQNSNDKALVRQISSERLTPVASPVKLMKRPPGIGPPRPPGRPSMYDSSQEQIAEKAKQEAYVVQRIAELQREGLWSEKRLPKVHEPPRAKAHWDYLIEEMIWLAADFAQERKWKKAAARKCARQVQKHFQEKAIQAQKAEKNHEMRLKKIASFISKEIKTFWNNVEKLVEYKQQTRLEEKRKKALDQHLSFIVDQTEKYSSWLAESMNKSGLDSSITQSQNSSGISSPNHQNLSDDEFQPNQSSTDDEETIAKEEAAMKNHNSVEEIELLKRESELPIEDLLKELPDGYLEKREDHTIDGLGDDSSSGGDTEFLMTDDEVTDDEQTIQEQEEAEGKIDHKKEIQELEAENELDINQLMEKYGGAKNFKNMNHHVSDHEEDESSLSEEESETDEDSYESEHTSETEEIGLKSLLDESDGSPDKKQNSEDPESEINDVAAIAESIQPRGNTLSSTNVVTKIPFLLKHTLREYQHIGLEWLVTMFDRKLNGILADEMGLGKTIQTISLLAHLACEKGNWGPHLIVVPTSVMLNWEMELRKWCPAFKILTYYGSQKERRHKRTGWTKANAFHVCITSYKLVIQDHQSFRRKKWVYLILDEAQNIKNFKSQRWQLLLNFQTQRRLLLTGTPLQNNLMELWSLMHFLMPNIFHSHREFREWFSNPVTGMIEGNSEYNENLIKRLHKVLRPFLLRRLKSEVEKQLPRKYEHVVMCRLSKRQRFLYDDFMSRAKTKETLATGNLLSVINVLMQLRKVCNHPNLFEERPTISPFQMEGITYRTASLAFSACDYNPSKHVSLSYLNLLLADLEVNLSAVRAYLSRRLRTNKKLIFEADSDIEAPRCPAGRIKLTTVPPRNPVPQKLVYVVKSKDNNEHRLARVPVGASPMIKVQNQAFGLQVAGGSRFSVQLFQHPGGLKGGLKAVPVAALDPRLQAPHSTAVVAVQPQLQQTVPPNQHIITKHVKPPQDGVQKISVPANFAQLVQSSLGQHLLLTSTPQVVQPVASSHGFLGTTTVMTPVGQKLAVISKNNLTSAVVAPGSVVNRFIVPNANTGTIRPVMRVPPLNISLKSSVINTIVPGTQTVTTTTAVTNTKTSSAIIKPLLSAVIQQPCNGTTKVSSSVTTRHGEQMKRKEEERKEAASNAMSEFFQPKREEFKTRRRNCLLESIDRINQYRCNASPMYGTDVRRTLRIVDSPVTKSNWKSTGYCHCLHGTHTRSRPEWYWTQTCSLCNALYTPQAFVNKLHDIFSRYIIYVPAVAAPQPKLHVSHPPPSKWWNIQRTEECLQKDLSPHLEILHPIASKMVTQFPDPRLIQYDCGKLQLLDRLLRQLKKDHHRVLIFTQMTRMLDVLEAFLNYHGHIYLRLDGTTRVDQRQLLMERFNADSRIFCFILSTRSGGIGVNLTGADTVIFYDSDWNPTMDAQAQDRCHRIGQTRDVHIYRLISEMTVEENILKKANQKRLLGDVAIEGGNFTTAYFKSSTIQDLFTVDTGEKDASKRMADVLDRDNEKDRRISKEDNSMIHTNHEDKTALGALESALAAAEDDTDVQATRTAKAEAAAELAEFDETIPIEEGDTQGEQELSKAEQEVQHLIEQLTPVERYAMRFVEETEAAWSAEQLAAAEAEIEQQKREWELNRLQALKEEETRQTLLKDDEEIVTYSQQDANNQVWISEETQELMTMWSPPTPPQDDNDVYLDQSMVFLYEQTIMSESHLPPVYIKKETKKCRIDGMYFNRDGRKPVKNHPKEEVLVPQRSIFERPPAVVAKLRRDLKLQKYRIVRGPSAFSPKQATTKTPEPEDMPEWTITEDWVLLMAMQAVQKMPLTLMIKYPGHTPNWELASDMVNSVSHVYRSSRHCRYRFETVIAPREEGRILYDLNTKKKKSKAILKGHLYSKSNRPLRTSSLYMQDNNKAITNVFSKRFESLKSISSKRTPNVKPLLPNPNARSPKLPTYFTEYNITYDNPLTPEDVAARRAERILKEKQKNAQANAAAAAAKAMTAEKLALQQRLKQQQQQKLQLKQQQSPSQAKLATPPLSSSPVPLASFSAIQQSSQHIQQQSQSSQLQQQPVSKSGETSASGSLLSSANISASSVSPVASPQAVVVGITRDASSPTQIGTIVSVAGSTVLQTGNSVVRSQRPVTALTIQEMVAANQTRINTSSPIVSVANLVPSQLQTASRLGTTSLVSQGQPVTVTTISTKGAAVGSVTAPGKALNASHLQLYRQQTLVRQHNQRLKEQQLKALQAQAAAAGQSGQKISVAITSVSGTNIGSVAGVTTVQIPQTQQRAQFIKQAAAGTGKHTTITRTVSESEMAALIKRQQQIAMHQQKLGGATRVTQVQIPTQSGLTPAQILAQAGLQVQQSGSSGQTQVATLVKTVSASGTTTQNVTIPVAGMTLPQMKASLSQSGMKATTQQQQQQLALHQQLALQRKLPTQAQKVAHLAQVASKAGMPAQLIMQTSKAIAPAMTLHQIQHVVKSVQQQQQQQQQQPQSNASGNQAVVAPVSGNQVISHAVLAKASQGLTTGSNQSLQTRIIPVSGSQQTLKQTIQVVAANSGVRTAVPAVTLDGAGRQQQQTSAASTLASALAGIKVAPSVSTTQQALLSQVSAALQGQPVSVAVRQTAQNPVRIQTSGNSSPLIAVTVQQQQQSQSQTVTSQQVLTPPPSVMTPPNSQV